MVKNSTNINITNNTTHFKPFKTKQTTINDIGTTSRGYRQALTCGVV